MRRLPLLVLLLLDASAGWAHDIADPRVLVLVLSKDKIELRVNELTPVPESEVLRRRFDGDRSGTLDDSELSDLTSYLAIVATRNLGLEEAGVSCAPGIDFGAGGEGFLRFSYATDLDRLREGVSRLRAWSEAQGF